MPLPDVPAFTLGEAGFKACQLTHQFIKARVLPRVRHALAAGPNPAGTVFVGSLLRVIAWTNTLSKLDEPSDFQAGVVATRTLFEVSVDLTLMHFDPVGSPCAKLEAWEESCKLEAARKIEGHYRRLGASPSARHAPHLRFLIAERSRVEALRATYWNGKHRLRWTGTDLGVDARKASQLFPSGDFAAFYETRYPEICWNTHGSGLGGVRNIRPEHFAGLSMLAFQECIHFALVTAEVALRQFGLWDEGMEAEFQGHASNRARLARETVSARLGEGGTGA
jgi:hypothetical protein